MSQATVIIMCPKLQCRAVLRVPATVRGKKIRCGECGTVFTVPAKAPVAGSAREATPDKKS